MNIAELLSDITFFNQGQTVYAYMISGSERTLTVVVRENQATKMGVGRFHSFFQHLIPIR